MRHAGALSAHGPLRPACCGGAPDHATQANGHGFIGAASQLWGRQGRRQRLERKQAEPREIERRSAAGQSFEARKASKYCNEDVSGLCRE